MNRQTKRQVRSILREHAERRSVDELVREGTRHIRVLSGERVLAILQAIVDDAVADSSALAAHERERLVRESKQRFDDLAAERRQSARDLARLAAALDELRARLAEHQAAVAERDAAIVERDAALAERDATIARRDAAIAERDAALAELRDRLAREAELRDAERRAARDGLAELRDRLARLGESPGASAEPAPQAVQAELAALRDELRALGARAAPAAIEATLEQGLARLVEEIASRQSGAAAALEERFGRTLDKTLDEIGRTVRSATARPVDRPVEATDAVLGRILDDGAALESNYADLAGPAERTSSGVGATIERLRELRAQGADEHKARPPASR